jgi:hypothetical protein
MELVLMLVPCTKNQLDWVVRRHMPDIPKRYWYEPQPGNTRRKTKHRMYTAREVRHIRALLLRIGRIPM